VIQPHNRPSSLLFAGECNIRTKINLPNSTPLDRNPVAQEVFVMGRSVGWPYAETNLVAASPIIPQLKILLLASLLVVDCDADPLPSWGETPCRILPLWEVVAHGSLILRAVCENRDRASYRWRLGSQGTPECAVAHVREASDDIAGGARPG
jgi:hypothetical protein